MIPKQGRGRKKGGGNSGWLLIAAVVVLIVILFLLLEYLNKSDYPETAVSDLKTAVKNDRVENPVQKSFSSPVYEYYSSVPPSVVTPPMKHKKSERMLTGGGGAVSIIVDDMGSSVSELKQLQKIGIPITFSVIPGLAHSKEVAETASGAGYQVMLHIPMEPEGYPAKRVEKNALLVSMNDEIIRDRIKSYLTLLPSVSGANNHMGSRFTANQAKMEIVMEELKAGKLFFIDSMTTPASKGYAAALKAGVPASKRTVFLDNRQDIGYIKGQLNQLVALAGKHGSAIGICHPHPETIKALAEYLPVSAAGGTKFVSAGELVYKQQ